MIQTVDNALQHRKFLAFTVHIQFSLLYLSLYEIDLSHVVGIMFFALDFNDGKSMTIIHSLKVNLI